MNMHDKLNEQQRKRLAEIDAGIVMLLEAPLADDRILRSVERRLRWRRRARLVLPPTVAASFAVYVAPTLWTLLQQVVPMLPGDFIGVSFDIATVTAALASMPIYVWALVAGAALTALTTLFES